MNRLKSRKFLLAIIAAIVAFGNGFFEWGLSDEQVTLFVTPIVAFIAAEGAADAVERYKKTE